MTPDRAFEDFYPQLQSVVAKILVHVHDFSLLFSLVSIHVAMGDDISCDVTCCYGDFVAMIQ